MRATFRIIVAGRQVKLGETCETGLSSTRLQEAICEARYSDIHPCLRGPVDRRRRHSLRPRRPRRAATLQGDLLKDWTSLKDTMAKLATRSRRTSTPSSRRRHSRASASASCTSPPSTTDSSVLGGKATAPTVDAKAAAMTKEAAMKAMADSFDYGSPFSRSRPIRRWCSRCHAAFMGPSTRARVLLSDWAIRGTSIQASWWCTLRD